MFMYLLFLPFVYSSVVRENLPFLFFTSAISCFIDWMTRSKNFWINFMTWEGFLGRKWPLSGSDDLMNLLLVIALTGNPSSAARRARISSRLSFLPRDSWMVIWQGFFLVGSPAEEVEGEGEASSPLSLAKMLCLAK